MIRRRATHPLARRQPSESDLPHRNIRRGRCFKRRLFKPSDVRRAHALRADSPIYFLEFAAGSVYLFPGESLISGDADFARHPVKFDFLSSRKPVQKGLLFFVVAGFALLFPHVAAARPDEARVALIIGNSSYRAAPLANPANDAADLAHALEQKGFTVLVRENVSERGLKEAVEAFAGHLKKGGVGLFFFAGHGIQLKDQNYLLPTDLGFDSEADIAFKSVSAEYVLSRMADAGNRVNIVILDACRNNPFQQSRRSVSRGLGAMSVGKAERGTFIAYATSPGATAADGEGRNGLYTKYLLQSLFTEDSDIDKVFGRVRSAVVQETNGDQVPWISSSLVGNFFFDPLQDGIAARAPAHKLNANPDGDQGQPVVNYDPVQERAFWERIKDSRNVADFKAYLERFPSGPRVAYSRWMIVKHGGGAPVELAARQDSALTMPSATTATPVPPKADLAPLIPSGGAPLARAGGGDLPGPGAEFSDCPECPRMVTLAAGSFVMGSGSEDVQAEPDEQPAHRVQVPTAFAIGKFEVTRAQYAAFVKETGRVHPPGCNSTRGGRFHVNSGASWRSPGFSQQDNEPVVCVNWDDAQAYASWLAKKTGKPYRLPNEAEWEYAARGGTTGTRYWADGSAAAACKFASVADSAFKSVARGMPSFPCADGYTYTAPVGRHAPNAYGLHDMLGNVWEWVEDCWNQGYAGAPGKAEPRSTGTCEVRVFRGGAWNSKPASVRAAYRDRDTRDERHENLGFRVAR
jgi:formylglycine-generating enzyme required for sulfatase activity